MSLCLPQPLLLVSLCKKRLLGCLSAVVELLLKGLDKRSAADVNTELLSNLLLSLPALLSVLCSVLNKEALKWRI